MAFKLYENKSSIEKKNSRMLQGGIVEEEGDFLKFWERRNFIRNSDTDFVLTVTRQYEGRPDLIAFDVYDRASLGWLVLQYNNIVDPTTELVAGTQLTLPDRGRVIYQILTRPIGTSVNVNSE
jgi:hypothetical protein